ncbi:hypothetical protein G9464_16530 [Halostella sp. JP-L12]|uniref:hypothetical protein n=1 Tax=Halostella TaxID=1843185 RepID=UPI000EF75D9E|nr:MULTISPECIES: hypothetical protein [Halostella]NHN49187.1 hypothetical protein [Halostella sp. JP-L12]
MGYYDRLLGGMLASLLAGAVVGFHPVVQMHQGLAGGAALATLLLWEGLFRNPPVPPSDRRVATAAAVWHGGLLLLLFSA